MKGFFKKSCLGFLLAAVLIAGSSFSANAEGQKVGEVAGHPIYDNHFGEVELYGTPKYDVVNRGIGYPAKYDPRVTGMVTKVEDQGMTNTCWAFASIAAMESNLIKKGYANSSLNLSENHLAYFFYNRQTDKLGYTKGDKNVAVGASWDQRGGTLMGTGIHAQTWSGVVKETTSEDDANGMFAPRALPAGDCYKSDYRVNNTYFYVYDVNSVKQAITDHGAVASGIYMENAYWDLSNGAYYDPYQDADGDGYQDGNHAVTIVGWDDNYSKDNFNNLPAKPKNNGAWIVKNSYGATYKGYPLGDYGYMYVSYEDATLSEIVAYDVVKASSSYDNNYQHDGTAVSSYLALNNGATCANVFKTKAGSAEVLKAVSLETMSFGTAYSVQVYTGVNPNKGPTSGKKAFSSPQKGVLNEAGYQQIKLKNPVVIPKGQYYSVVITVASAYDSAVALGVDTAANAGWVAFNSNVGAGQSFLVGGGDYLDMSYVPLESGVISANFRIKAYTDNITYKLDKSMGISKGSSATLKVKTNNKSYLKKMKWSSSNTKVATVSSKGKIKAKTYGTATIKCQFTVGGKKKTLSTKLTVGPAKLKSFKVSSGKKKFTASWKRSSDASGYEVYYSKSKTGTFKKVKTISSGSTTKCSKTKLSKGTYYVKARPYKKQGSKKLYGSYTSVKKVKVK